MMKRFILIPALMFGLAVPASADEIIGGFGPSFFNSVDGKDSPVFSVEYRPAASGRFLGAAAGLALALDAHGKGDVFAGIGLGLRWDLNRSWFVDMSLMPGFWHAATAGNDLGGDFQFRSTIGPGYRFADGSALSLALSHKSNAHIEDRNPGLDMVLLRWHVEY